MKNIRMKRFIKISDKSGFSEYQIASRFDNRILFHTKSRNRRRVLYRKYLFFLKISANLGYPLAQESMALAYGDSNTLGFNNPDENEEMQMYWFKKACDNDIASSCNALAVIYERRGLIDEAIKTYNKAIALGDDLAVGNLATLKFPNGASEE